MPINWVHLNKDPEVKCYDKNHRLIKMNDNVTYKSRIKPSWTRIHGNFIRVPGKVFDKIVRVVGIIYEVKYDKQTNKSYVLKAIKVKHKHSYVFRIYKTENVTIVD